MTYPYGSPDPMPRRGPTLAVVTVALVAAAVIAVAVVAVVLVMNPGSGANSGGLPNTSKRAAGEEQPRTEAGARAAAQTAFDLYSAGDYGGFWDSWSAASQGLISRDDYVRLFDLCKPIAQGLRFEIANVTVSGDTANVAVTRLIGSFTFQFHYEDGRWRYIPDQQALADYRAKSVEQMAAEKQAAQACAK